MKTDKKREKRKMLIKFFLLLSVIFTAIILYTCYFLTKNKVKNTRDFVASEVNKVRFAIDSRLLSTKTLEIDVMTHKGEVVDFEEVAAFLHDGDPAVRSLQLAPDGIVTYVYPSDGNDNVFIDLFSDPERKEIVELARDTGQTVLSGPFELLQGGMGLVANDPVYLTDENGQRTFWGFSTIVLNVPEIFEAAQLDLLTSDYYYYRLWRYLPGSGQVQVIAENTDDKLTNAIQEEITISGDAWYLDIAPRNKWVYRPLLFILITTSTVIIVLSLLAFSSHLTVLEQKEELIRQNNTDGLTGIKNGRYFMKRIRKFAASHTPCAVFYLDLNHFKEINDKYGHDEGDKILKEVAKRIESCIRDTDIAARIGGDEFTLIIGTDVTEEYCIKLKEQLKQSVAKPYMIGDITYYPGISVGFARYPSDSEEIEKIMRIADQRMYEEKHSSTQGKAAQ